MTMVSATPIRAVRRTAHARSRPRNPKGFEPRPRLAPLGALEGPVFYYNATARDVMSPQVATVPSRASLLDALEILRVRDVSGLPVVDAGGRVVGVLSERDIGRAAARRAGLKGADGSLELLLAYLLRRPDATMKKLREILGDVPVSRVMSRRVRSVPPDATVETVVRQLLRYRVNRLPVLDHDRLIGIVTRDDVLSRGRFPYPAGRAEDPEFAPENSARQARRIV